MNHRDPRQDPKMLPSPPNQTLRLIALVTSLLATLPALALDANDLVKAADAIRFPTEPFQVEVKVTTTGKSGQDMHAYQVLQKGHDNSVVRTTAPASEKGQVMLLKGADLWVFMPNVSQPVRLPLSQRLTGQVANGDLARANFSGDYNATLVREEVVDRRPQGRDLPARAVLGRNRHEAPGEGRVLHGIETPDEVGRLPGIQRYGRRHSPRPARAGRRAAQGRAVGAAVQRAEEAGNSG
jgi:hypothetical protein